MKKLQTALLAAVFGATSVVGITISQAQHPGSSAVALADDHGDRGEHGQGNRGKHKGWYKRQNGCNGYTRQRRNDDEDENENQNGNRGYNNGQYGQYPNGQYPNGQYPNGQYPNGQYGNNNCYSNGGNYGGQYGNASITGTIVAVNGNQVTILSNFQPVTINDQPALDNRTTGRVSVGRSVTAYGYWQGGTFFATRLQ